MAYVTPIVWTSSVTTPAQLNQQLSGNMSETAVAKATTTGSLFVGAGPNALVERYPQFNLYAGGGTDTTNSGSYTALTGGAACTATTTDKSLVFHGASLANDSVGARSWCSFAVSGASTIAADDNWGIAYDETAAARVIKCGVTTLMTGMTPGSNVFTQQFRVTGGIGSFVIRHLGLIPL
jgi:hypothetical protein